MTTNSLNMALIDQATATPKEKPSWHWYLLIARRLWQISR